MGHSFLRRDLRPSLRQWLAYEKCLLDHLKQGIAARMFGVTQQAISGRIKRYRVITARTISEASTIRAGCPARVKAGKRGKLIERSKAQ